MPLSLPNITCPLTHFLNKILRLRADMEQIGRTSKSEDFTSIFAPICGHGAPSLRAGPYSFPCPPQRRNMYGPQHGDNAGEDSWLGRTRSLGTRPPKAPTLIRFLKEPSLSGGLHSTQYQKGSRVSSYTRPSEGISVAQIVSSGVDTRRERGDFIGKAYFVPLRPKNSLICGPATWIMITMIRITPLIVS